ncbi:BspA family leucine-rich repeat surface protein [Lactobacillus kitasatonis]|uniref:BspA family leucine-rich repeat surface protein n=1 Tax=Lactobacillus kitasatonis TaxID=237446 RepID=UPI0026EEA3F3|nr:BspA family leucine-rich repeat surface protein [Lactobacillus kitasatonis]
MLSKNNFNEKLREMDNQKDHFAIRKLTIGVASVLIGITFMGFGGQTVHADEGSGGNQPAVEQVSKETTTNSTQQNNDAQKDVATAQKTEVATDSQANNQTDNTKESAQLVKPITEADVKATTESQKAEIADKTNEVKPSDTQVQEKQKEQTSEVKTPDTTSNKDEQKSDQTQRLVVDKKAIENTQAATDIAAEKVQKTVQPQAKIQALIALPAESESQFNVDDWDGSLDNTTHEYTLNKYHGDKENIYIPNTQDFINAGRISSDDKVYITKDLMNPITINGAVNVTVDDQGEKNKVYAKGDWYRAFSNGYRTYLKHVDLSHVDTKGVTNMNGLFFGNNDLQSVNFSGCDLSNVTDTSNMFAYADWNIKDVNLDNTKGVTREILDEYVNAAKHTNKTNLDLSGINLSPNVTSLHGLFANMSNLESVNLSGLDISHITDMGGMFSGDSNLESLDLSGLDLSKVTNTNNMFDQGGGKNIKSVNITNTKSIPRSILDIYLKALSNAGTKTIDLSGINLSPSITSFKNLFSNMPNLESVNLSGLDISHITDMRGMFSGDSNLESLDLSGLDLSNVTDTSGMFAWADGNIKSVNLKNTKNVTDDILRIYARAIKNSNATTADLSDINLSPSITSFNNLFSNMPNIESIDLTGWDTGNITDMSYMFFNDPKLTTIKGLEGFDTSNVTNMSNMFASYTNPTTNDYNPKSLSSTGHLESLDLSNWKTGNVTNMNFMFGGQTYLTSLGDLRHWDTRNVTDMRGLFYDLENIPALDLSNWVTDKVTDMSYMFNKMSKIKNLDSISEWHTHNVVDMSYMFNGMTDLEGLDLSNWDPSSVGNNTTEQNYSLARMFSNDINLTKVGDLSKWADKTGNVHSTRWMFYNTPKLENVDLHGWTTGKLQIAEGMFWKSGAKHINLDGWDLSGLKRITAAGYVEGSPNPGNLPILRGNEHMFQDLVNKSVISMNGVTLPMDVKTAFMVDDFSGDKPIIVIANGKDGEALDDLLKLNTQKWTNQDITGRQNSDFITYVRADDNTKQIGHHGLNFIFTNLNDLHNYFNNVTNRDVVKADMANDPNGKQLVHDWNAQNDVDGNNIVKTVRRVSPDSSYDPYSMAIHYVDGNGKGNMLADLMTSKYQLYIVAPTTTTETKNPTRKIIIENPDGSTRTKKQTVEFTRNVTKHIDGTEEDTPWTPASGNWDHFDVPQHDGYDSYIDGVAGTSIGAENINADTNNVTIHVTYKSNTPDNPEPDNPEPEEPRPETPEVPNTPDEPNEPEKLTVPKKNDKHKKSNKSENTRPNAKDKAKNKKNSKTHNAGVHGQTAPHAATAPNRLVAPKGDQLATGKGLKELNNKPASAAKANANNKETLPQTGEEKDNVGLLGLGLLALAALGFVDRKRRD